MAGVDRTGALGQAKRRLAGGVVFGCWCVYAVWSTVAAYAMGAWAWLARWANGGIR